MAAQVLLSTYNGSDFQLDLTDMGSLDRNNFEMAMTIIRGRYETSHEPHSLMPREAPFSMSFGTAGLPSTSRKEERQAAPTATAGEASG